MKKRLKDYVDGLFATAAPTKRNEELKEELLGNLYAKYDDYMAMGKSEEAAYEATIRGLDDIGSLFERADGAPEGMGREEMPPKTDKVPLYSDAENARKKKTHPILQAVAVMLYVLCVIPVILWGEVGAVCLMLAIIAVATGILIYISQTEPVLVSASLGEAEKEKLRRNRRGRGICLAVGVGLYILCPVPTMIVEIGVVLMFVLIAVATALMILNGHLFPVDEETTREEKAQERGEDKKKKTVADRVLSILTGCVWVIAVLVYLCLSLYSGEWWITWMIFPITACICGVMSGVFRLCAGRRIASSIVKISICSILLIGMLPIVGWLIRNPDPSWQNLPFVSVDGDFYAESDRNYQEGNARIEEDVHSLDVHWVAGDVRVAYWQEDYVAVEQREDESDDKLCWRVENGVLDIRFGRDRGIDLLRMGDAEGKALTVYLPDNTKLDSLEFEVASATVTLERLVGNSLDVDGISGKILLEDVSFAYLSVDGVSGDVTASGSIDRIECECVSATVKLSMTNEPLSVSVETVSGNVHIDLPEDCGFAMTVDGVSSSVTVNREHTFQGDTYLVGDGATVIEIDAVSGNVYME